MSDMATVYGKPSKTITKVERYGWSVKDAPGKLVLLNKSVLQVHPAYQRHAVDAKVRLIASAWSWVACGSIVVGVRGGEYWVIDGQHRVMASKLRSDIDALPCLLFETESVEQEARGFLDANTGRKPVTSLDKFRARIASGDETAKYVDTVFRRLGIVPRARAAKPLEIKSVAWAMDKARENRAAFEVVIKTAAELCQESTLQEILLQGLYYIQTNCDTKLDDKRMNDRLKKIGQARLVEAGKRSSAYFTRGGAKVWADGMLLEINKGLHNKISSD